MRLSSISVPSLLLASLLAVPLLGSASASAFASYPNQLPNGNEFSCSACHISPGGGGARTPFGESVDGNGPGVQWDLLYDLDSDGDGQTNGEELGDPCGDWDSGAAPRTTDISNPGVDTDTSADPNTPTCLAEPADAGSPEDDAGAEPAADAGDPPADAGDVGPADAGAEPEPADGGDPPIMGPCACTSTSNPTTAFAGLALMAFGSVAFFGRRRRR